MNDNDVIVKYSDLSNNEIFVSIFIGNEDVSLKFGLSEFVNEMGYLDVSTRFENSGGRCGFVFANSISKSVLERDIENFARRYIMV